MRVLVAYLLLAGAVRACAGNACARARCRPHAYVPMHARGVSLAVDISIVLATSTCAEPCAHTARRLGYAEVLGAGLRVSVQTEAMPRVTRIAESIADGRTVFVSFLAACTNARLSVARMNVVVSIECVDSAQKVTFDDGAYRIYGDCVREATVRMHAGTGCITVFSDYKYYGRGHALVPRARPPVCTARDRARAASYRHSPRQCARDAEPTQSWALYIEHRPRAHGGTVIVSVQLSAATAFVSLFVALATIVQCATFF